MKKLFFLSFFLILCCSAESAERVNMRTIPAEDFLKIVRRATSQETWSKMAGKVQHRRTGASVLTSEIRLGVRFTPVRVIGQLVLDGKEFYNLGQTFSDPPRSTRSFSGRALEPEKALLPVYGLSPDDLLLGFLYQDFIREEPDTKVSIYHTRVLRMRNSKTNEIARVYISTDYAFPLKVEWFRKETDKEPYRTLEIVSIKEKDDFVLISKLRLDGDGWRTRIDFSELDAGYAEKSIPADLFLKP